ncbi:hypothetical protein [Chroococcus sp. FPU101]|uniref:hypothetical protein n=1 Tax=Chroococcus sp. FPU101 TaxID=1974212 RepID=UPI001A8F78DC|nr:hypothetical protein [Chroococcus sp. FPU101]GFE70531.1 hypothetical protein CFPU101_31410 [Chroococcus sp. FPU101]
MSNDTILARLKVADFFHDSNWFAQPPQLQHFSQKAIDPVAQLRLNLEEFFSQNNWNGSRNLVQPNHNQTKQGLSLTLSVEAYFQCQFWSSQPAIAVVPQVQDEKPKTKTAQKFQITDLSNLF